MGELVRVRLYWDDGTVETANQRIAADVRTPVTGSHTLEPIPRWRS
jgi:hypothetical protein